MKFWFHHNNLIPYAIQYSSLANYSTNYFHNYYPKIILEKFPYYSYNSEDLVTYSFFHETLLIGKCVWEN